MGAGWALPAARAFIACQTNDWLAAIGSLAYLSFIAFQIVAVLVILDALDRAMPDHSVGGMNRKTLALVVILIFGLPVTYVLAEVSLLQETQVADERYLLCDPPD